MAETLRSRVARVIAGGAHAFLDKIEDVAPVAVLEQSVREVDAIVDEVRTELGRIAANRHLAQQQHLNLNREHEQLAQSVATALRDSRDDLAKVAIARQFDIEAQLPILETSLAELTAQEKEISGYVDALMGKKREMEAAVRDFESSRQAVAAPTARNTQTTSSAGARLDAVQSAFDRTYQRQTGLTGATRGATIEQSTKLRELDILVRENKINERLAALKAKD